MKLIYSLPLFLFSISCQHVDMNSKKDFSLFHYNIKELDSTKFTQDNQQLMYVQKIIKSFDVDILSLNEVQYDYKNVPNSNFQTKGQNLQFLKKIINLSELTGSSFKPANTGMNARKKADGTYYISSNNSTAKMHADQVNFGTMPGQYSTGALFKFPKTSETIITDLKWKDFNKGIDLSKFKMASGKALPEDIKLFDKNFSDITLNVKGKELHLILLHTVPAFGFGNRLTPNLQRNADQLRFLEWYLTGKTDIKVDLDIMPITGKSYVAVGDFNTDINDESKLGSLVLKSLFSKSNAWIEQSKMTFSNESSHYGPNPVRLMLDYITTSNDIEALSGMIIHPPFERKEIGCAIDPASFQVNADQKIVKYLDNSKKECFAIVDKNYYEIKEASDHYPLYGTFRFK